MHYKSRPKKLLYLLYLNQADAEALHTGLQVYNGAGEPVGESMFQVMTAEGNMLALAQLPVLGEAEISALRTGNGLTLAARVF